ncbi:MAG: hypothetical protein ACI4TD_11850 [Phocaeicola sp.]
MKYYCISYLQERDDIRDYGVHPIYYHLPVTTEVTTDLAVAEKWFQNAVDILSKHYGRKLLKVTERKLDYMCYIKQAHFECTEAAYAKGKYLIELSCFNHNPLNFD